VAATQAAPPPIAPLAMPVASVALTQDALLPRTPLADFAGQTVPSVGRYNDHGIALGSIGSDIFPAEATDEYWMITDRGPNGKLKVAKHVKHRTMPAPEFNPTIVRAKLAGGGIAIQQAIPITTTAGQPVTGLPNTAGHDEPMYDLGGLRQIPMRSSGLDTEGLVHAPNGDFWVSEEYGPSILHLSPTGTVLARFMPEGTVLPDPGYPVFATLPAILAKRQDNRGFESLAMTPDGGTLYASMQSPLGVPSAAAAAGSRAARLFAFSPETGKATAEYVYPLENVNTFDRSQGGDQTEMSISGLAWYDENKLVVDERTDNVARLYLVDIDPSRNILGSPYDDPGHVPALEQTDVAAANPLAKTLFVDLAGKVPGLPHKIEGVAVRDPRTVVVSNDNDFGLPDRGGFGPGGRLIDTGAPSKVMVVNLS
jgi:hypothetical protein